MSIKLDDLVAGTLPKEVRMFGKLMEKHFGVACRAYSVLTGDACDNC
jgi:hypothetical protein